ncbi:MAG: hypothetical protein M1390_01790 [Candidatus Marsarchaeota archaeon]|nr:hypothetical protein [Candidatus Marsarchaeota archaeon]
MAERVYVCDEAEYPALKKALEYDPYLDKSLDDEKLRALKGDKYANVIFSRQEYSLREGAALGLEKGKYYLYIKANEDFMKDAEERLAHEFKSVKRAPPEAEGKVIALINEEQSRANEGFGSIFGG